MRPSPSPFTGGGGPGTRMQGFSQIYTPWAELYMEVLEEGDAAITLGDHPTCWSGHSTPPGGGGSSLRLAQKYSVMLSASLGVGTAAVQDSFIHATVPC